MSLTIRPNLVSTIIPVFNRPDYIVEAVASVIAQTHRPIEIIIVDDGSTDRTPEVLEQLMSDHPEVSVYTQRNSGPGAARELGRLNAKGEYIQYLDSDDVLLPEKFDSQIQALKSHPDAVASYGKTEVVHMGEKPSFETAGRDTGIPRDNIFPSFLRERWWFTSTPLYTREVSDLIGPWSSETNEEDWEYDSRLGLGGGELVAVDCFVSLHRIHDAHLSSEGSSNPEKLRARARSRAKVFNNVRGYEKANPNIIRDEDWRFFSDYAFLLARQCALQNLITEARAMVTVSIEAVGRKTVKHKIYLKLVKLLGWQKATKLLTRLGR